jgi:hypothetical protein
MTFHEMFNVLELVLRFGSHGPTMVSIGEAGRYNHIQSAASNGNNTYRRFPSICYYSCLRTKDKRLSVDGIYGG